jgi:hypothetical protein
MNCRKDSLFWSRVERKSFQEGRTKLQMLRTSVTRWYELPSFDPGQRPRDGSGEHSNAKRLAAAQCT